MTNKIEVYKCEVCGNIVQVLSEGAGELVCCGEAMKLLKPQFEENEIGEKHVPKIETDINGRFIRLSHHPMIKDHYIELIEAISKDGSTLHIKFLRPEDKAEFDITGFGELSQALELCNIHELWRN